MSNVRKPSPARSQGSVPTARPRKVRNTRSVGSPARSNTSGRLTAIIQFQEKNSFFLSPVPTRRSVLNDETDIEEPRRRSWWKKLGENSRDVMEILDNNEILETNEAVEEFIDIEVLSQEKKNYTLDIPESSDSESISSIVIPQRKLFTHKENQPQNQFGQLVGNRETMAKLQKSTIHDKTVHAPPKNLFNQANKPKPKPIFPAALLNISPNKTANKTKEIVAPEVKGQVKSLFGNRPGVKRKNMFADFIVSESEDEISDIQPKVFGFQKEVDQRRESSTSHGKRDPSPTSSITTDVEMDEWKLLPSSTMVEHQLEDMMAATRTPVKRPRLSKLTGIKESEHTEPDKSILTRSSSKASAKLPEANQSNIVNKSSTDVNTSKRKSKVEHEANKSTKKNNTHTEMNTSTKQNNIQNEVNKTNTQNNMSTRNKSQAEINSTLRQNKTQNEINKSTKTNKTQSEENLSPKYKQSEDETDKVSRQLNMSQNEVNEEILEEEDEMHMSLQYDEQEEIDDKIDNKIEIQKQKDKPENNKTVNEHKENSTSHKNDNTKINDKLAEIDVGENKQGSVSNVQVVALKEPFDKTLEKAQKINSDSIHENQLEEKEEEQKQNDDIEISYVDKNDDEDDSEAKDESAEQQSENEKQEASVLEDDQKDQDRNEEEVQIDALLTSNNEHKEQSQEKDEEESLKVVEVENQGETYEGKIKAQIVQSSEDEKHDKIAEVHEESLQKDEAGKVIDKSSSQINESEELDNQDKEEEDENEEEENENEEEEIENEEKETENENEETENEEEEIENEEKETENEDEETENEEEDEIEDQVEESQEQMNESREHMDESSVHIDESAETEDENEEQADENEEQQDENVEEEEEVEEQADVNMSQVDKSQERVDKSQERVNESQERVNESQERVDESQEQIDESEEEVNESQEQIESEEELQEEENQDAEEESDQGIEGTDENGAQSNDEEIEDSEEQDMPNVTHDTTGRHRNKEKSKVNSPEAILHDKTNQVESFIVKGRNTSLRRTSMMKSLNIRPSLAPHRDSTGVSDGTTNSSGEGSGWDSHRTTRKTLRQTFGKDFTPRKSLRALVMEKSAKRQTAVTDLTSVTSKFPQANSTELPEASNLHEYEEEIAGTNHDMSKRTRQTTLQMYLQKINKQNMERKMKMEEEVRNSLKSSSKDINLFKVPSKPMFALRKANTKANSKPKAKQIKSTLISLDDLPPEVLEDLKYKPPKRFQPSNAAWITKRLYKFLENKLQPKYDYKARVRAEKLVQSIYEFAKDLRRHDVASHVAVDELKQEMARQDVVRTHFDFYQFFHDYMPREIRIKVVPDVVNKIPMPRHGVFTDILRGNTVQE